jgi:hypothetical protein
MKKYLIATCAALAMVSSTSARGVDSQNDWVLLTLGWSNGTGAYVVTASKGAFVPEFANKGQCQVASLARSRKTLACRTRREVAICSSAPP